MSISVMKKLPIYAMMKYVDLALFKCEEFSRTKPRLTEYLVVRIDASILILILLKLLQIY